MTYSVLQFGIRYNYREPSSKEIGEERELGCDTAGGFYQKNNVEWVVYAPYGIPENAKTYEKLVLFCIYLFFKRELNFENDVTC